jgi:hypothetical protein
MVPRARHSLGKGARCLVLLKFLRPSKVVAEAIVNLVKGQRLDDFIAVSHEVTTHGGKSFVFIFFRSNTIPGLLHSSAEHWVTVLEQPTGKVWSGEPEAPAAISPLAANKAGEEIADFVFHAHNRAENITLIQNLGFEVDNDNKPAPKNIPTNNGPRLAPGRVLFEGQEWGWDRIDQRAKIGGLMYNGPTFTDSWSPQDKSFVDIFLCLFPIQFLEHLIVKATSRVLVGESLVRTTLGEMLQYIGMWLLMSCYMKPPEYF